MVIVTISDILTRIRNANLIKSKTVLIPLTRISKQIVEILEKQGFIESFQITNKDNNKIKLSNLTNGIIIYLKYKGHAKKPCITNLKRISKPGCRIYANHKEIPKVLGGLGIAILSTSKGIMTDQEARFYGIGGEILCSIW